MKVVEGLQIGNECLKKMHQVGPRRVGAERKGGRGLLLRSHLGRELSMPGGNVGEGDGVGSRQTRVLA